VAVNDTVVGTCRHLGVDPSAANSAAGANHRRANRLAPAPFTRRDSPGAYHSPRFANLDG
jgi:hypothetical protein